MPSRPTADYDYRYPPEAIAQVPLPDRAASRLLVLERRTGALSDRTFHDIVSLVEPGDVIVVNASRVIPARLVGTRSNGRDAEVLLIHPEPEGTWLAMVHPGGKLKVGRTIQFGDDTMLRVVEVLRGGVRRLRVEGSLSIEALMDRHGQIPLPPYITRPPTDEDRDRYQTVFAREDGSVAAPTAGLHFTAGVLDEIRDRGATVCDIVLHVGPGTFKPVETDDPLQHPMHAESFLVPPNSAAEINRAKSEGRRVWAVGTTVVRTLESCAEGRVPPTVRPGAGWTDLFIFEPYRFKIVDAMITNFHLPRTTLLMLVAAFAGYERTMQAYAHAIREGYRLYSYGDAMAIV